MKKKWTKEAVFEESKKYSSKSIFKKYSSGAFSVAYKNGWLKEMIWLKKPEHLPIKWTKEVVFSISKEFNTYKSFRKKYRCAYTVAKKKGWLDEMVWLEEESEIGGFWKSKDNVFNESHKYNTIKEFREVSKTAYIYAKKNGWLDEMTWLKRTNRPAGFWSVKENVIMESRNYQSTTDFCDGCYLAYINAKKNGWLDEMPWLTRPKRKEKGYWNVKENVLKAAEECEYKTDFKKKFPSAYNSARAHHWFNEITFKIKESKGDPRSCMHSVYVYEDNINKYAYVGATNDIKRRDYEHRQEGDIVYSHFVNRGLAIPECKILLEGLNVIERQREEHLQSLYYRDILHYSLINKISLTGVNIGSLGSLIKKWSKKAVMREAKKYTTPTEFLTKSAGAYDAALRFKMMNKETFPWFYSNRMPTGWWNDKEHVFEESKRYESWDEFFLKSPAAHFSARKHKWEDEMTWLIRKQAPQKYWQSEENVIEESKKYTTRTEFFKECHAGYDYAQKNDLWDKMPWIKQKNKGKGYWTKERVFEEAAKYFTKIDFKKNAITAYGIAVKNKWLEEMKWFVSKSKPRGYWQVKKNVFDESHKYQSRADFRWGSYGAYRSAIDNGWIDEMKWLKRPQNYNFKWTREKVFEESRKYEYRGAFKKISPAAYRVAYINGWLDDMVWLKKRKVSHQ